MWIRDRSEAAQHLEYRLERDALAELHAPHRGILFVGTHRPAVAEFDPVVDGDALPEDLDMKGVCPEAFRIPDHDAVDRAGADPVSPEDRHPEEREIGAVAHPPGKGRVEAHGKEAGGTVDAGERRLAHPVDEGIPGLFREGFGEEGDPVDAAGNADLPSAVIDQVALGDEEGDKENRVKNAPNHAIFTIYFNDLVDILRLPFFLQIYM